MTSQDYTIKIAYPIVFVHISLVFNATDPETRLLWGSFESLDIEKISEDESRPQLAE